MDDIIFEDRRDAGRRLAKVLAERKNLNQPLVVLGIPRGGLWWQMRLLKHCLHPWM